MAGTAKFQTTFSFDLDGLERPQTMVITFPEVREFTSKEILQMEKEVMGLYLSGHPLSEYRGLLQQKKCTIIEELNLEWDRKWVTLGGIITTLKRTITRKGQTMAYFTLEDLTGSLEALIFPSNYLKLNKFLAEDLPVLVEGRLNFQEDQPKIMVDNLKPLDDLVNLEETKSSSKLYLKIAPVYSERQIWEKLAPLVETYTGDTPLYLYFPAEEKLVKSMRHYWVKVVPDLIQELQKLRD